MRLNFQFKCVDLDSSFEYRGDECYRCNGSVVYFMKPRDVSLTPGDAKTLAAFNQES